MPDPFPTQVFDNFVGSDAAKPTRFAGSAVVPAQVAAGVLRLKSKRLSGSASVPVASASGVFDAVGRRTFSGSASVPFALASGAFAHVGHRTFAGTSGRPLQTAAGTFDHTARVLEFAGTSVVPLQAATGAFDHALIPEGTLTDPGTIHEGDTATFSVLVTKRGADISKIAFRSGTEPTAGTWAEALPPGGDPNSTWTSAATDPFDFPTPEAEPWDVVAVAVLTDTTEVVLDAGVLHVRSRHTATGTSTVILQTASGLFDATGRRTFAGTPSIVLETATGVFDKTGHRTFTGTPAIIIKTASGVFDHTAPSVPYVSVALANGYQRVYATNQADGYLLLSGNSVDEWIDKGASPLNFQKVDNGSRAQWDGTNLEMDFSAATLRRAFPAAIVEVLAAVRINSYIQDRLPLGIRQVFAGVQTRSDGTIALYDNGGRTTIGSPGAGYVVMGYSFDAGQTTIYGYLNSGTAAASRASSGPGTGFECTVGSGWTKSWPADMSIKAWAGSTGIRSTGERQAVVSDWMTQLGI